MLTSHLAKQASISSTRWEAGPWRRRWMWQRSRGLGIWSAGKRGRKVGRRSTLRGGRLGSMCKAVDMAEKQIIRDLDFGAVERDESI
ncbi:hypothetical protein LWI28_019970 [Acer negundo]|uniref:Uncharacterized protein n=1 Tax=Acer negundo TaxID=4023 RepID=A0AAD5JEN4_ACENE|nr:hypothetical protein LWI28_019970 [Acer negundo]